ncbi:MAG: molecular chaperone TorD family protein [Deltaproteobacteria bacterium]|nr:molecular chaperone TorD family protein [Deltaproteobacteria bacterium]
MPNDGLHNDLVELEHHLDTLGSEAATHITQMRSELLSRGNKIGDLCVDFAKLFVGPYALPAPPYGSVYLDGESKVMGDSTIDVCMRYAEVGLELADHFKEVPDHIAAELEFMYFLILKEVEAISHSDFEQALDFLKKQEEFFLSHLGVWVPQFADNVEKAAETEFYKSLSKATRLFIKRDVEENFVASTGRIHDSLTSAIRHRGPEAAGSVIQ